MMILSHLTSMKEIKVLPSRKESIPSKKILNYLQGNVLRGAIDNTIDNIIDRYRYLKYKLKQRIIDSIVWGTTLLVNLVITGRKTSIKD